jgi:hypothetical protein
MKKISISFIVLTILSFVLFVTPMFADEQQPEPNPDSGYSIS